MCLLCARRSDGVLVSTLKAVPRLCVYVCVCVCVRTCVYGYVCLCESLYDVYEIEQARVLVEERQGTVSFG